MNRTLANQITGGLGKPSKMPGMAYGLPAAECKVGSKLRAIPGSVCAGCYALKGRYILGGRQGTVQSAQYRRLASITHPLWADAMVWLIEHAPRGRDTYFRWHDSGDVQDLAHLLRIVEVCDRTPRVHHWLPTREKAIVLAYLRQFGSFPFNLVVRLSDAMVDYTPAEQGTRWYSHTSGVHRHQAPAGYACPAKAKYGNTCGPCRACWLTSVPHVSYPWH